MKKPKILKKVCIKCFKLIEDKSNFYSFTEWDNDKVISVDYAHRECWDNFMKSIDTVQNAQSMLKRMEEPLINMGIMKPREVFV